ncbi:hypothetical protein CDAR_108311 [Caerostris darwini]|uniref:Uncharacterized protein n=1 Tax=Caerostris darwini TaxID=1538125 RepID=A0AAV4THT4_9ARAC|nr:hypothetical protein CDAR_108311 [Caerostris darwini]
MNSVVNGNRVGYFKYPLTRRRCQLITGQSCKSDRKPFRLMSDRSGAGRSQKYVSGDLNAALNVQSKLRKRLRTFDPLKERFVKVVKEPNSTTSVFDPCPDQHKDQLHQDFHVKYLKKCSLIL